jgi:mRNA interferase MazF
VGRVARLIRGEIYLTELEPTVGSEQAGTRPAVIVSRDSLNNSTDRVSIVPFTTYRGRRPVGPHQFLVRAELGGLRDDSVALCEQVRALDKSRLGRRLGSLHGDSMLGIDMALRVALALDLPPVFRHV